MSSPAGTQDGTFTWVGIRGAAFSIPGPSHCEVGPPQAGTPDKKSTSGSCSDLWSRVLLSTRLGRGRRRQFLLHSASGLPTCPRPAELNPSLDWFPLA